MSRTLGNGVDTVVESEGLVSGLPHPFEASPRGERPDAAPPKGPLQLAQLRGDCELCGGGFPTYSGHKIGCPRYTTAPRAAGALSEVLAGKRDDSELPDFPKPPPSDAAPVAKGNPGVVEHHILCRYPTIAEIGCKLCIACGHVVIRGSQYRMVQPEDAPNTGTNEEARRGEQ